MGIIYLEEECIRQPSEEVEVSINRSNKLGEKCRFAIIGGQRPAELCEFRGQRSDTSVGISTTIQGFRTYAVPASSGAYTLWGAQAYDLDPGKGNSFSVCWYGFATLNVQNIFLVLQGSSYGWYFYLEASSPGFSRISVYSSGGAQSAGQIITFDPSKPHMFGVRYDFGVAQVIFFVDGIPTGPGIPWTADSLPMGDSSWFAYDLSGIPASMITCQAFEGSMSGGMFQSWFMNPWQVFTEDIFVHDINGVTLALASGVQNNIAETFAVTQGHNIALSDASQINVAGTFAVTKSQTLIFASAKQQNFGDSIYITSEMHDAWVEGGDTENAWAKEVSEGTDWTKDPSIDNDWSH